jgi:Ca2+-binding RTX toxin-like protein
VDGGAGNGTILGGQGNDSILGGTGADRLDGGASADLIVGGEGDHTFFFGPGSGRDTITDFSATNDKIEIRNVPGVDDFSDLRIRANANGDVVVSWGTDANLAAVTLSGVAPASLTSDAFSFG